MPAGRPLKFQSVEELDEKIEEYFKKTPDEELTITGLALALGCDRHTVQDYRERDEYSTSIKKAYLRVENSYEKSLRKNGRSGDIFALKNFGWKDKIETTNEDYEKINNAIINLSNLINNPVENRTEDNIDKE